MLQIRTVFLMSIIFGLCSCASFGSGTADKKRAAILEMKNEALAELYERKPYARKHIESAEGYAVFSNANVNVIFISAGTGYGMVQDFSTGQTTYMNMAEGGVGFGVGVKDYRLIIAFHTKDALNHFIYNGWTFGGSADATAKASDIGGSVEGEAYYTEATIYTFTKSGLALQATVKGTKFWRDAELN